MWSLDDSPGSDPPWRLLLQRSVEHLGLHRCGGSTGGLCPHVSHMIYSCTPPELTSFVCMSLRRLYFVIVLYEVRQESHKCKSPFWRIIYSQHQVIAEHAWNALYNCPGNWFLMHLWRRLRNILAIWQFYLMNRSTLALTVCIYIESIRIAKRTYSLMLSVYKKSKYKCVKKKRFNYRM